MGCFGALPRDAAASPFTITPTFGSSITTAPNAAAIEADIDSVISLYEGFFTNPINVGILFQTTNAGSSGFLGESNFTFYRIPYGTYTTALKATAQTPDAIAAMGTLPGGNMPSVLDPTSADARAVGFSGDNGCYTPAGTFNCATGTLDGIITLNIGQPLDFTRSGGAVPAGDYDATRVIEHEVDEILGIGADNGITEPLDLFRYSAPGVPTLNKTNPSYFSIDDGATSVVPFNTNPGGDAADWAFAGCTAFVQEAFSCSGQVADVSPSSPEFLALNVIGYDTSVDEPSPVPEPSTLLLLTTGGLLLRRRGRAQR